MNRTVLFLVLLLAASSPYDGYRAAYPAHLTCEYQENPLGVDVAAPRLRWQLVSDGQHTVQRAYRITVGTDSLAVLQGNGNAWHTGRIPTDDTLAEYAGDPLAPFTRYFWKVSVWTDDQTGPVDSPVATFETGMLGARNWRGHWITDSRDVTIKPAAYFRKAFSAEKEVASARAYIATGGLYELYLNGRRVGDHRLDPAFTRYDRRTQYVTYDVTSLLQAENAIGVLLGNGWYNHQSTAVWYFHEAPWRARPRFCLDLRITYTDGSVAVIRTGDDWKTALSPVIFNSIYTGEHHDARRELPGWNQFDFDDTAWDPVELVPAPAPRIVSQQMHPIRYTEEIVPVTVRRLSDRRYLFDLGRNIAGITRIKVAGEAGTTLRVTHAELLDEAGHIDQSNIDLHYRPTDDSDPFQTDLYTLSGRGVETFAPHFNYKGFQYVEVASDRPVDLDEESLVGVVMHSDVPAVGRIHSSNPTLNKLWAAANSSYLANLFGYPTDCPQREKNGWTGDAHIAIETGLYNFDGITIYEKWLADHRDEQQPNGVLPAIIPTSGWGYQWANGPDWTSTIALIPWNLYLFYGDVRPLAENYDNIKRYVDHITDISPAYLTDWGLGDWVPVKSVAPKELTSSIYYYVDATILSKAARLLDKPEDARTYTELAERIRDAINDKYYHPETATYGTGLQTELSAPLHWGIVPDSARASVAATLARRVLADDRHIDVGLLGSKTILNALSDNGYADLAYAVAAQETYPSWGWWIVNGATTLLENWNMESQVNDISHNHIMFGEISAWYYKALGGIKPDPEAPGFKHIMLEPHFVEGLDHFAAEHAGPHGLITSAWERKGEAVVWTVTIPPNSRATVQVPATQVNGKPTTTGRYTETLGSGQYAFTIVN